MTTALTGNHTSTPAPSPGPRSAWLRSMRQGLALQRQGALLALIAVLIFGVSRYGGDWLFGQNMADVLSGDVKFALLALGMTFVIMTGGIDLSVGSVALLGGVLAANFSEHNPLVAILGAVIAGAA